jgi:L-rhamnose-H+ transport protein
MNESGIGLCLLVMAGAMNGSFTVPMKFTPNWEWENTWFIWTVFALLVFPSIFTFTTIPSLHAVYSEAGLGAVIATGICGAGWGISVVFFGLAVEAVGTALAFSIILGISAAVGSLIPLIRLHPEEIMARSGMAVIGADFLILIGVAVSAVAGRKREIILGVGPRGQPAFGKGLLLCTLSGAGSALLNMALIVGGRILEAAENHGARKLWSPNAVFLPLMLAGALPNLFYCVHLMLKNCSAKRFRARDTRRYWLFAALMAFCWFGSATTYGVSTTILGELGTVIAWPLFMSLIVITAAAWGLLTGEWRNTGVLPLAIMSCGVSILVIAIFMLSFLSSRV